MGTKRFGLTVTKEIRTERFKTTEFWKFFFFFCIALLIRIETAGARRETIERRRITVSSGDLMTLLFL